MMKTKKQAFHFSVKQAYLALKRGDRMEARRWARKAAALDTKNEKPWLLMGMTGTPRANLAYFAEALSLNPNSSFAKKGIRQLVRENGDKDGVSLDTARSLIHEARARRRRKSTRRSIAGVAAFLVMVSAGLLAFSFLSMDPSAGSETVNAEKQLVPPSATPTAVFPVLAAETQSGYTPIPTYTPLPTATPTSTPTPTPEPTLSAYELFMPIEVEANEYWVDVDLTNQTLTAFRGQAAVQTFVVSTGVWQYPTVTGQYQIYVKYEAAPMSGPGYYLPGVPYVMYFYRGYGLHGTYWHNNFGTPMSHGCVNLKTEDAAWLFGVLEVGSWVNVHY